MSKIPPEHCAELADFFKRHCALVYHRLYMYTRQHAALTDDLLQTTFEAVAEQWPTMRTLSEDHQLGRLLTIARNKAIDEFRSRATLRRKLPQLCDPLASHNPHDHAVAALAADRYWRVICQLPEQHHLIAVLRWRDQLSYSEIAELLKIPEGTVATRLRQVRAQLDQVRRNEEGEGAK